MIDWKAVITGDYREVVPQIQRGFQLLDTGHVAKAFTFDGSELWDNGYWIAQSGFNQHSSMARVVFETSATSVDIDVYANGTPDAATAIQVWVDGFVHASPVLVATAGAQTITQSLPDGPKTVFIVAGVQAIISGVTKGVFLVGCTFDKSSHLIAPRSTDRLLVYGDSIAQGGDGSPNVATAWPNYLRKRTSGSVVMEAASGRSLWDDANTSGIRAAFVALVVGAKPARIWLAIGTNDYAANKWSATSFATAYAAVMDDLHTALPAARIYCQTPIMKGDETANGSGNILEDYRVKIRDAWRTRSEWSDLIEGPAILSETDLETSTVLHPTDIGNQKYAAYVESVLNGAKLSDLHFPDYGVTQDVVWQNTANVTVTGNSLQKTAGTDAVADAGGSSTKAISGGNAWWARFTITETNKVRVFGVGSTSTGTALADIRYGFNSNTSGLILLWQAGAGYTTPGFAMVTGDQFQLRGDESYVYYEMIRGGVVTVFRKASVVLTTAMFPLYAKAVILGSNGTVTNAQIHGILQ